MRRPLAMAALLFVAAVKLATLAFCLPVPIPEYGDGQEAAYTGEVVDIVESADRQNGETAYIIYLKDARSQISRLQAGKSENKNPSINHPRSGNNEFIELHSIGLQCTELHSTELHFEELHSTQLQANGLLSSGSREEAKTNCPTTGYAIFCRPQSGEALPEIGSYACYEGKVRHFRQASNPGEFDAKAYYNRQGYAFELTQAVLVGKSEGYSRFRQCLYLLKKHLGAALEALLPGREASVAKAMLLGEKGGMDKELKSLYQRAGISHILAISGLHISLLGMGVFRCLSRFFGKRAGCVGACLFLASYLCMTGFSSSSLRAGIMFAFAMAAQLLGRTYDPGTALAVAAALLVAENPACLEDVGFGLSFSAAAGAVVVVPAFGGMQKADRLKAERKTLSTLEFVTLRVPKFLLIKMPLARRNRRKNVCSAIFLPGNLCCRTKFLSDLKAACGSRMEVRVKGKEKYAEEKGWGKRKKDLAETIRTGFRASFCISLATLPVLLSAYYEWNMLSVLLNMAVVPLMGFLLGGCILLAAAGGILLAVCPGLLWCIRPAALLVRAILWLYEWLCRLESQTGLGFWRTGKPQPWQIAIFYLGLLGLVLGAKKLPRVCGYGVALALSLVFLVNPFVGGQMTMLDVGQGDCIYIRTGEGKHYLYDGGSSSKRDVGTWQVIPFLKYQGVDRLEMIFVSHWDADHISAVSQILEWAGEGNVEVGGLTLSAAGPEDEAFCSLLETAFANKIPVYRMRAGEELRDGNSSFLALYPAGEESMTDRNACSLVLRYTAQRRGQEIFSALLTGDVGWEGEERILQEYGSQAGSCSILKVAHHGSDTSSSEAFLDWVLPRAALISCGRDNSYGHPHEIVLERFSGREIPFFVTASCGALTVRFRKERMWVETFLDID